ncbi:MAG TPA: hypothetical protein VFQ39_15600, partial [Longimicrobium sp.]|nr:hypothetical protein [Longimicrobium sp.]
LLSSGVHLATYSGMLAAAAISTTVRGDISEADAVAFYSTCYREHYLRWMALVSTFYDQNSGKETYFWQAQRLSTGDLNQSDARLAFSHLVGGIEDLKEAGQTDLLAEISTRVRASLSGGDEEGGPRPNLTGDILRAEDLRCLPTALGYRVVTEPRLRIVPVIIPVDSIPVLQTAAV